MATYISVLLIGGFYTFSVWCMVIGAGADTIVHTISALKDPTTFVYSLSDRYASTQLTWLMGLLFITSVYAGLLAFHNSAARYFFAVGREGLLPARIGRTHATHKSPHVGSAIQSTIALVAVTAFALWEADPVLTLFSWLTNTATVCVIGLMALSSFAVVAFFRRDRSRSESTLNVVVLPIVSGLLLSVVLVLAVAHFSLLTGASSLVSYALMALLPLFAAAGWIAARGLQRRSPSKFLQLGRSHG